MKKGRNVLLEPYSALAAALTMISLCLYRPILYMMRVPPEAMRYACEYMSIMSIGVFFVFGYNAVCAIVRGLGDAKSPLLFVAAASVINIILDALLVGSFKLATQGAVSATVIAQGSAFIIAVIYLRKRDFVFDFKPRHFRISSEMLIPILKIGLPSALQLAVVNLLYLMVTSMLNVYGVANATAAGIGLKINTFLAMPCWAIGTGVTTMVGQNMGAQKPDRVRKILKNGLQLNLIIVMLGTLFIQCTAP
ncbi:MATE family efflux transporter [Eubacterium maltosivorans]|uniref:MATE family efflux transporter n=1 Tax=Eubacterium maltosivorans TaxID=2041044 RepID=UPI00243069A0|nr:MATE family efflux transporter [Eubacterium maltosivorans]